MKLKVKQQTANALQKLKQISKGSDDEVQYYLAEHERATIDEIAKGLDWTTGKVDGVLKRLEKQKLAESEIKVENTKVKRYYELIRVDKLLRD